MSAALKQRKYDESVISSDSDEYHKVFFSSSSHDRSSVGSIPWAEDAIKQTQQEWERIERMFYGEEDLPDNEPELRREIIEWTTAFPHLRIMGRKVSPPNGILNSSYETNSKTEESYVLRESGLPNIDNSKRFIIHPEPKSILMDMELTRLVDRDLRINSVPMVSKRRQIIDLNGTQRGGIAFSRFTKVNMPTPASPMTRARQIFPTESLMPSRFAIEYNGHHKNEGSMSRSARIVRMPPIVNFMLLPQTKYLPTESAARHILVSTNNSKSASRAISSRTQPPLELPILKMNQRQHKDVSNRSISAALNEKKLHSMFLTKSASKLKTAK